MKASEPQPKQPTSNYSSEQPFFGRAPEQAFFSNERSKPKPFFTPSAPSSIPIQARAMEKPGNQDAQTINPVVLAGDTKTASSDHNQIIQTVGDQSAGLSSSEMQHPNRTGLPDQLKTGVESLSGISLDHVKVHYNSSQPAQLNALAYTQGGDIHVAPGQENHLPHEAWHVVQQAQGRVQPTMQLKGKVPINTEVSLEKEAETMGAKAKEVQTRTDLGSPALVKDNQRNAAKQRKVTQLLGRFRITEIDRNQPEQVINNERFQSSLVEQVNRRIEEILPRQTRQQNNLKTRVAAVAGWPDREGGDVPTLTNAIVNHLTDGMDQDQFNRQILGVVVETAIVYALPSGGGGSETPLENRSRLASDEIGPFRGLIDHNATQKTRQKGVSNRITLEVLEGIPGLSEEFQRVANSVRRCNRDLTMRMKRDKTFLTPGRFSDEVVSSAAPHDVHLNAVGWLPAVPVILPRPLAQIANDVNAEENRRYMSRRQMIDHQNEENRSKAREALEASVLLAIIDGINWREKIKLIWGDFSQARVNSVENYVEFYIGGKVNRLVYDYVNGRFYLSIHYNWYLGYNPFFEVIGETD